MRSIYLSQISTVNGKKDMPWHPLLVHIPIAFALFSPLVALYFAAYPARRQAFWILWMILFAAFAYASMAAGLEDAKLWEDQQRRDRSAPPRSGAVLLLRACSFGPFLYRQRTGPVRTICPPWFGRMERAGIWTVHRSSPWSRNSCTSSEQSGESLGGYRRQWIFGPAHSANGRRESRSSDCLAETPVPGAENSVLDLLQADSGALVAFLKGAQVLFHLAGMVSRKPSDADRMTRLHVDCTRKLLEAAQKAGVERVILASTSGTVGISRIGIVGRR